MLTARHPRRRRNTAWYGAALPALVATVVGMSLSVEPPAPGSNEHVSNLVVNGSFEAGVSGWRTNDPSSTSISPTDDGRNGSRAVALSSDTTTTMVLNDDENTVEESSPGTTYHVSAWVRTTEPNVSGQVRVREVNDDEVASFGQSFWLTDTQWHRVDLAFTTKLRGSHLDLNVLAWNNRPDNTLVIDGVTMVEERSATTTTEGETGRPPEPPASEEPERPNAGELTNGCSYSQRGIPSCGVLVGASIQGNADPSAFEADMGRHLGVHRTFWQGDQVENAVRTAERDLAHQRLPWISFKLPHSWRQMADGAGDAWARDLAQRLSRLDGPVWVAFHHEPQHDGDITQWTAMQNRLAPIIRETAPNVGYTIILSGWNSVSGAQRYRLDSLWPEDAQVDVLGIDTYNRSGVREDGARRHTDGDLNALGPIAQWAEKHQVAWAISETGYTDYASKRHPNWISRTYQEVGDLGGVAFSYFNSDGNSVASWDLSTPAKRADFADILQGSPSLPDLG